MSQGAALSTVSATSPNGRRSIKPMDAYKRLLTLVLPYWRRLAVAMLCMLAVGGCTAASAYLIKPVLDDIFINKKEEMLRMLPFAVLFVFAVKGLCSWGNGYLMSYVGLSIVNRMRQMIYDHLQMLSLSFFDRNKTGNLMSRMTSDVNQIQSAVTEVVTGTIKDFFSVLALLGVVFYRDWKLAGFAVIILPLAFFPIVKFGRSLRKLSTKGQQSMGNIMVILHETLGANRIVKAFCMEDYEKQRFARENRRYFDLQMHAVKVRSMTPAIMEFLGGLGIVFIIAYGGYSVVRGDSTPGNFFSFLAAVIMLYEPVKRLSSLNNTLQQGIAAAVRVYSILDIQPEIVDAPAAAVLSSINESVELRDVSFGYGDEPVLQNINLRASVGQVVALVGMSGSGKTTLVNLIPRFYDVSSGAVLIDGTDIRRITTASLRSKIALVTQKSILFNDTIRNNILYGDISKDENAVVAAAKAANAYDFILQTPDGFDTIVGEQGVLLSGGQQQRLCIARALLKDAPILILDEATSSLDSDSEQEVQRALENLMIGRTTIVIAHRLSTVKNADRIVVMSGGRIIEEGRHEELLIRDG